MASTEIPRLVIAGVASNVGKTTVTIGLARAFRQRGLRVALFKCGPDYLDPTYHARAAGAPSQNLDGWMMGHEAVRTTFAYAARDTDVALVEGVMGLFDGATPTGEQGSTAEIAKWLRAPVVLVVDAGGMARSFAAVVNGFATFDTGLPVSGTIANRIGSAGHLELLKRAQRDPPVLGGFVRDPEHTFPDRHLGLHTADDTVLPESLLEHWGERASKALDVERILDLARSAPDLQVPTEVLPDLPTRRCRIGVATDEAFHFYYADNLRRLEELGAELVRFSPIRDAALPDVDGLYLGGGYPEVHAAELSANTSMRDAISAFARKGGVVYAECGGLMYLTDALVTLDGKRYPMVGLFRTEAHMRPKLQALGYAEVETQGTTILGGAGTRFRGHEFRYSELVPALPVTDMEPSYTIRRRRGDVTIPEGYRAGNVLASYVHAHWASNPRVAAALVESCAKRRDAGAA